MYHLFWILFPAASKPCNSSSLGPSFGTVEEVKKNGKPLLKRQEIICPTNSLTSVILDVSISNPKSCPTSHLTEINLFLPNTSEELVEKEAPSSHNLPTKEAVDRIRRQRSRMNQHKKRRYRHKNLSIIQEQKHRKKERRAKQDLAVIDRFRSYSANFSGEEKIMQDLEMARRGGFYVECFGKNREDRKNQTRPADDKSLDIL